MTRDGIWTFSTAGHMTGRFILCLTTQGKAATFNRELARLMNPGMYPDSADVKLKTMQGRSGATPFPYAAPTNRPVIT